MTEIAIPEQQAVPYPLPKWLMDRLIPSLILLLAFPIWLVVLFAMGANMLFRSQDRGPWLYRERRISLGKEFNLLKFRVLKMDVLKKASGHVRRYEGDLANLTWTGRYLKKWYLDELPQLLNIIKGDMSLVGPRPWPVHMAQAQYEQNLFYRKYIRAGWTGPAQVQKGSLHPESSVKLDQEYLERCRRATGWVLCKYDWDILGETIRVMREGKGLRY